jgi:hypothetical protein
MSAPLEADAIGEPEFPDVETLVSDLQATIGVMRHLTYSPNQVTDSQWAVVVGRADQIADTLYQVWQRHRDSEIEERKGLHAELAPRRRRRRLRAAVDDLEQAKALWVMLRSAARVVTRQTDERLTKAREGDPDAKLIALCVRLVAISDQERTLYATIKDESARNKPLRPLTDEWCAIRDELYKMDRPATSEGAHAVALAAQANADHDRDKPLANDLGEWLALAACAYLTGTAAPGVMP